MSERHRKPDDWHPTLSQLIRQAIESPESARRLVKKYPQSLTLRTGLDETALHWLAVEDFADAVGLLIELGADVNVTNKFGHTPLDETTDVRGGHTRSVLIAAGAVEGNQLQGD
ncbi:MAG: ankyrin repeat domain-containing protein [Planctomycetota bacterium]